jgi:hypothetical protein
MLAERAYEVAADLLARAHELRPAAPAVVAVGGLPAVEVGDAELQLERQRPRGGALLDLGEAVVERAEGA